MDIKISKFLLVVALVQILLLLNFPTAQSYQISESSGAFDKAQMDGNLKKLGDGINFMLGLFSIKQIGLVSAVGETLPWTKNYTTTNYAKNQFSLADTEWACCAETYEGAICQSVKQDSDSCENPIPSNCEDVSECMTGCCVDPIEGTCASKSTKWQCENDGGVWASEQSCLIDVCQKGCCVIGQNVEFVTERRCEQLSAVNGWHKDFRDYDSELACIALQKYAAEGACILDENACLFLTETECVEMSGNFNENVLCSNPKLYTDCEKQVSTSCIEGKDEIYWIDSCGNRENIYSSDKDFSWNDGNVLPKGESCNPENANINSKVCGNCDYYSGSKCSADGDSQIRDGEEICKSVKCLDENGESRENGESWCVYDGIIGDGKDVVGSRHWKRTCIDGEIKAEGCADYRGQICVQSSIDKNSITIDQANCVINDASTCVDYNSKGDMPELCDDNPNCLIKNVDISDTFQFDMCVGAYPRGFDLTYEDGKESADGMCSMADQECIVMYEKKITGWECVLNCECRDEEFGDQLNNLCVSLGDCGSYVNIEGKGSNSVRIEKSKGISWEKYIGAEEPILNQYAKPKELTQILNQLVGTNIEISPEEEEMGSAGLKGTQAAIDWTGKITGAIGTASTIAGWIPALTGTALTEVVSKGTTTVTLATEGLIGSGGQVGSGATSGLGSIIGGTLSAIGTMAGAMSAGMLAGTVANWMFGLEGDAALMVSVTGAGIGLGVGITLLATGETLGSVGTAAGGAVGLELAATGIMAGLVGTFVIFVAVLVIVVVLAAILAIIGIGDTEEVIVKFDCQPWQAPLGEDDCSKCNDDPLKPCSQYRCNSLGKACGLINPFAEKPECVAMYSDDGIAPKIVNITTVEGFAVTTGSQVAQIRTTEGECIREFTTVPFMFETEKYSQCKFDIERTQNYSAMKFEFLEKNMFEKTHIGGYMMPSISSFAAYNLTGDMKERLAKTDLFIRCIDNYGNSNKKEFVVNFCLNDGPDLTAPVVMASSPPNEAYIKRGVSEIPLTIYTNEPAECGISTFDDEYSLLNKMDCKTDITDVGGFGWPCSYNLTEINNLENNFFIKCKDQPWLEGKENATENATRNKNAESFVYTLYQSLSELKIDSITPTGEMDFGFSPVSIDLEVKTSGGMEGDGKAKCEYSFTGPDENMIQFMNTFSDEHKQNFNAMMGEYYHLYVKCSDDAGNVDTIETEFKLNIDTSGPQIVRTFLDGHNIKIVSDEPSTCYYSTEKCNFNFENATKISSGFSTDHIFKSNPSAKYHIKCQDNMGNTNPYCAIILSEEDLQ